MYEQEKVHGFACSARPSMRALVRHEYGPSSGLRLEEVAAPRAGAGEVLVAVRAAGLDRGTWHVMTGLPLLYRVVGGLRRPRDPILGLDFAGTVIEVGREVESFAPGDEVFGFGAGSLAELAAVPVKKVSHRPPELDPVEAAARPVSATTALQAITAAGVSAGHRVLVSGASGGVGSYAVQMAVSRGAEVTGIASAAKADFVRELGAADVVAYDLEDPWSSGRRYDAVLDIAGHPTFRQLQGMLEAGGTAVLVGGEGGGRLTGGLERQMIAAARARFGGPWMQMLMNREDPQVLREVAQLAVRGELSVPISHRVGLDRAPEAMAALEAGEVRGKAVVTMPS
ncbi:NAD(P)-dependent alcohol dehydrogenase [Citricoccus sp. GCM10030269]|uniref:NAD(P)-dependent alcohol dehydrogenase n=1 Tax=Citricoccus sp. GCM10030269 TaxID=3273388 RepID=UPI003622FC8C